MQSANLSGPLKGLRPYQALLGPTQASGLAGGFDWNIMRVIFSLLDQCRSISAPMRRRGEGTNTAGRSAAGKEEKA